MARPLRIQFPGAVYHVISRGNARKNLSAGMQYLNGSYTSYFNRRHRRAGHLFQG